MKNKLIYIYSIALALLLHSCLGFVDTDPTPSMNQDQGAVKFNVAPSAIITKSSGINVPTSADFNISIDSLLSDGTSKNFFSGSFADMEDYLILYAGNYTATAISGNNDTFTVEKPTFSVQNNFTVLAQRALDVEMVATMDSYAVEIIYSDELLSAFSEVYILAEINEISYTFAVGTSEIAYLEPGDVELSLCGTTTQGAKYNSVIKNISSEGREHYVLNVNLRPAGNEFTIDVDTDIISYDIDETLGEELYPELGAPKIGAMEFYETANLPADYNTNALVTLGTRVETNSLTIQFADARFAAYEFDTLRVYDFSVAEDVADLRTLGMIIPEEGVLNNSNYSFSMGTLPAVLESVDGTDSHYRVQIISTAKYQTGVDTTDFNITVKPPVFTIPEIQRANIWSKEFTYDALTSDYIAHGDINTMNLRNYIFYEYSYDQVTWYTATVGSNTIGGLTQSTSGTKVYLRAKYRYTYSQNIVTLTTEATTQIPNNTFTANHSTENNGQPCYWFFADGASSTDQWWATRNSKTTSEGVDAKYTRYSGSRPNSGGGISLTTCGWGSGNTASGSWSLIYNIWAAKVFLGSYSPDSDDNDVNENHGKEFDSRPTGLKFDYTYDYYKSGDKYVAEIWAENRTGDVTTRLAYASASDGTEKSSWTSKTIPLTYSVTNLPITHICVSFKSGIYENPSDNENKSGYVEDPGFTKNEPSLGSAFCVNNVELIYGK